MAGLDVDRIRDRVSPHDGEVRCGVCATADPAVDYDWCPVASRLVCDGCCHRTLIRDMGRHMAALFSGAEHAHVPTSCARCERGQTWLAGEVLDAMASGELPS